MRRSRSQFETQRQRLERCDAPISSRLLQLNNSSDDACGNAKRGDARLGGGQLELKLEFKNVPKSILAWLERAINGVFEFNAGLLRMRSLESRFGGSGRYEYEYRCANSVARSLEFIKCFRAEAPEHGVDPEAVLSALGYEEPLTESQASAEWRRDASAKEQGAFKDELKLSTK